MTPAPFPDALETVRLRLLKHERAHAGAIFAAVERDRARLGHHLAWVKWVETVEDQRRHLDEVLAQWDAGEFYDYALFDRAGRFVGNAGVHAINWTTATCEIGYWVIGDREGSGLISEAVDHLTHLCFGHGFYRVEIRCAPANLRSRRVAERLGFVEEACLRGASLDAHGARQDLLIHAKFSDDDEGARLEATPTPHSDFSRKVR